MAKFISKTALMGTKLQGQIDKANGDDDLMRIIASMRHHGLYVSTELSNEERRLSA